MKNALLPALSLPLLLPFLVAGDPGAGERPSCGSSAPTADHADESDETPTGPTLARIQALVGDWYAVDEQGRVTDELVCTYRSTASGTAVLQTVFPGSEKEMLTVHHQDGGDLVSTHYCMLGNQPTYLARDAETPGDLVFECRGVGNLDAESDAHMHRGEYRFDGPDRMRSLWQLTENGAVVYTADHVIQRRVESR